MHRSHLVGCAAGVLLAWGATSLAGGSAGAAGVLLALLVMPLAMLVALHFLAPATADEHPEAETPPEPAGATRSGPDA